jgi:hypothetical protein
VHLACGAVEQRQHSFVVARDDPVLEALEDRAQELTFALERELGLASLAHLAVTLLAQRSLALEQPQAVERQAEDAAHSAQEAELLGAEGLGRLARDQ